MYVLISIANGAKGCVYFELFAKVPCVCMCAYSMYVGVLRCLICVCVCVCERIHYISTIHLLSVCHVCTHTLHSTHLLRVHVAATSKDM